VKRLAMCTVLMLALAVATPLWAAGTVEEVTFYSDALGKDMPAQVYLPDGYDTSGIDYPVVYFVHGMSHDHLDYAEIIDTAEQMISSGAIAPFILVKPEAGCMPYLDAGYPVPVHSGLTNSDLNGNFEDYFAEDLITWVDTTYRTLADREHRFVTGHSWGGYSSMRVGLRHPDVFSKVGSHAGAVAFEPMGMIFPAMISTEYPGGPPYEFRPDAGLLSISMFAAAASFSPNPANPPFFVDLALDEWGQLTAAWGAMAANSNTVWAAELSASGTPLDIYFDCGTQDQYGANYMAQYFSGALRAMGVPFTERWFDGDHWDHIAERLAVQYTFFMPLPATLELAPRIINGHNWWPLVEASIELPGNLDVADIDTATLAITQINGEDLDEPLRALVANDISDLNGNGRDDLTVWFWKPSLLRLLSELDIGDHEPFDVTVEGETVDEWFLAATDEQRAVHIEAVRTMPVMPMWPAFID
jgi:S-formylglutathione hydrolase